MTQEKNIVLKTIGNIVLGILIIMALFWIGMPMAQYLDCEGIAKGNPELYYYKNYFSNGSNSGYSCEIGNRTKDAINANNKLILDKINKDLQSKRYQCYNQGKDYLETFDFFEDYNYTCDKLEYINDHFILSSEQKDGGYLKGQSSQWGIFSGGYGSVEGKFYDWVNIEVSATGLLPKTISYHLDCNNSTASKDSYDRCTHVSNGDCYGWTRTANKDTKIIQYYTESDLVMYYVNNCIGD